MDGRELAGIGTAMTGMDWQATQGSDYPGLDRRGRTRDGRTGENWRGSAGHDENWQGWQSNNLRTNT